MLFICFPEAFFTVLMLKVGFCSVVVAFQEHIAKAVTSPTGRVFSLAVLPTMIETALKFMGNE